MRSELSNKLKAQLIRTYIRQVQALGKKQDKLFGAALKQLGLTRHGVDSDILFDALFNNSSSPTRVVKEIWPDTPKG